MVIITAATPMTRASLLIVYSLLFLSLFLQGGGGVRTAACFCPFESTSTSTTTAFVVTTTTWTTTRNHYRHILEDSFSVNKRKKKKTIMARLCSRSSMDETYDTLAPDAIEKLNLLRSQEQQQQQDIDNNDNAHPRQRQRRRRRRLWIGLAGGPGSGKSTVAEAVVQRINTIMNVNVHVLPRAMVLPMDGFHYTQAYLKEHDMDMKRRGAPWTFDAENMYEKLHAVVARDNDDNNNNNQKEETDETSTFWFPLYNREISDPVENAICINDSHDIIIVEGLYMLLGALVVDNNNQTTQDDPESSPLMQMMIQKFPDKWSWSSSSSSSSSVELLQDEIARWKPITDLFDETWYVQAPGGLQEHEQRLIQRSLKTWTPAKTKLWGGGGITAKQAATRRVQYNDGPNGQLVECCRPYADRVIETR